MAPHFFAWKIPWMEEPGRLQSMESQRVGHDWVTSLSLFTFMHWKRKWKPTSIVLAWRIPGMVETGGLPSMGLHRVGHDWSDLPHTQVCHSFPSKCKASFNFVASDIVHNDFGAQENKVCHCFPCFPIYLPWSSRTGCHDLSFLNIEF